MAFKRIQVMDLYQLLSRWHAGYSLSALSRAFALDRKTVRQYVRLAERAGLSPSHPLPEKALLLAQLEALLPVKKHEQPARSRFLLYKDEILALVNAAQDPLQPKTAYEVLCERYGLTASYTSFKRFVREHAHELGVSQIPAATCRFETEPGEELQIDYGKMGRLYDPMSGRERDVYAFIATLSYSRLKFVEFVYKQDQRHFVGSSRRGGIRILRGRARARGHR